MHNICDGHNNNKSWERWFLRYRPKRLAMYMQVQLDFYHHRVSSVNHFFSLLLPYVTFCFDFNVCFLFVSRQCLSSRYMQPQHRDTEREREKPDAMFAARPFRRSTTTTTETKRRNEKLSSDANEGIKEIKTNGSKEKVMIKQFLVFGLALSTKRKAAHNIQHTLNWIVGHKISVDQKDWLMGSIRMEMYMEKNVCTTQKNRK